ncbi:hypothetical protein CLV51_10897 [Chitinophaga niastensis]|uniref:Uncharacterized protein n=1 Tax=Chitinophaga niastensis TaxID=536980 RepID=A0A2P8HB01_CHINA|nr:hypothetical protein [Chitinophaga niastensis]PSL43408.1 hypothetical protein CLV51_10897 [Chitinophaga niastensis]
MIKKQDWKKYLLYGGLIFVAYHLYKGVKSAGAVVSSIAELDALAKASNVSTERIAVCKDVAAKCEKAIWDFHNMFGFIPVTDWKFTEDEPAVIQNLNRLNTVEEAKLTSQFYAQVAHGKSLMADVKKYLSSGDQSQIKITIINSLE